MQGFWLQHGSQLVSSTYTERKGGHCHVELVCGSVALNSLVEYRFQDSFLAAWLIYFLSSHLELS